MLNINKKRTYYINLNYKIIKERINNKLYPNI